MFEYTTYMTLLKKLQNIRPSWRAVVVLWGEELSFRIQVVVGAVVLLLAYELGISKIELLVVVFVVGAVLAIEALNTAIEELCDHVTPEEHPNIGKVKDLGSAAALLIGITAVVIGCIIFLPYLM